MKSVCFPENYYHTEIQNSALISQVNRTYVAESSRYEGLKRQSVRTDLNENRLT
jgi:hypothetical protein